MSDYKPMKTSRGRFMWTIRNNRPVMEYELPSRLFWLLDGGFGSFDARYYPTEEEAVEAVRAAIAKMEGGG
jgi:hypothetical protein